MFACIIYHTACIIKTHYSSQTYQCKKYIVIWLLFITALVFNIKCVHGAYRRTEDNRVELHEGEGQLKDGPNDLSDVQTRRHDPAFKQLPKCQTFLNHGTNPKPCRETNICI